MNKNIQQAPPLLQTGVESATVFSNVACSREPCICVCVDVCLAYPTGHKPAVLGRTHEHPNSDALGVQIIYIVP